MIESSVLDLVAERVERELLRVRAARPHLASRVDRAAHILVAHLSCRRQRLIRVRTTGGRARFLVSGSGGAVYVVDPGDWCCSCPDHHRRGAACKHSIACWALWRASARPAPAAVVPPPATGIPAEEEEPAPLGRSLRGDRVRRDGELPVVPPASPAAARPCASCGARFPGRELVEVGQQQPERGAA